MIVVRTVLIALAAGWVFDRLRIPAGALFGAMAAAAAMRLSGTEVAEAPPWLTFAAFVAIGWILGSQFTPDTISTLKTAFIPIVSVVVGLMAIAGLIAFGLTRFGVDPATAFLAASPGGISQMAALSIEFGANSAVVVTAHLMRIALVISTAPFILRIIDSS